MKDVLRHFEGQETHTVHLVCSPNFTNNVQDNTLNQKEKVADATSHFSNISEPQANIQGQSSHILQPNIVPTNLNWENFNMNRPLNAIDANQYAAQLAWMQQAYFQYMTQYMNL